MNPLYSHKLRGGRSKRRFHTQKNRKIRYSRKSMRRRR
jgi:hypothetical protein